ncbi:hypothetical protein [Chromobacterium sphagni]|uniref:Uncharacterized protein n=1 Tax=Chromobacterium sphagni TaxID=1903179 RepID=A0A1S1WZU4_9NEIS|nr:hypothetical protein [Chromobacterium sphagni]OHX12689.1 hypothetical protein BI347_03600 [Chromobacterium sphagni]OHX21175.1 hypothetical protein BI344_01150 [Chromobacterium sphagni]
MRSLNNGLYRHASIPAALVLLLMTAAFMYLFNFSSGALSISALARQYGEPILDPQSWCSTDAVRHLLDAYGPDGRLR